MSFLFFNLAVLSLSCGTQDGPAQQLWCSGLVALWHGGSQCPNRGLNPRLLHYKADFSFELFFFNFIFKLYIIVLVLPNIKMNPPQVYMCYGYSWLMGFYVSSAGKESTCNAGDPGSISGSGRSPGGGHGNPLQNSCLENPHGQSSLAGYIPWGCKEQTGLSD